MYHLFFNTHLKDFKFFVVEITNILIQFVILLTNIFIPFYLILYSVRLESLKGYQGHI